MNRKPRDLCKACGQPVKRKPNIFCSNACQLVYQADQKVLNDPNSCGPAGLRHYLLRTRGHRCEDCGLTEWRGNPIPLDMEHIDGDSTNNSLDNLKLLCLNCHGITPTYKARNKGNGRHERMKRYHNGQSF